jgi:hypothetical protein
VKKLDDRSTAMVFVGYEEGAKAYRCYNPVSKRLYIRRIVLGIGTSTAQSLSV